jgi:hypothetical protein
MLPQAEKEPDVSVHHLHLITTIPTNNWSKYFVWLTGLLVGCLVVSYGSRVLFFVFTSVCYAVSVIAHLLLPQYVNKDLNWIELLLSVGIRNIHKHFVIPSHICQIVVPIVLPEYSHIQGKKGCLKGPIFPPF